MSIFTKIFGKTEKNVPQKPYSSQFVSSSPTVPTMNYRKLADELAHFHTFSVDESEANAIEQKLLAGGDAALTAVVDYLLNCGRGTQSQYWWNNAKRLVRLIHRFLGADSAALLKKLIETKSNIWEYQTEVVEIAQEELHAFTEADITKTPTVTTDDINMAADVRFKLKQMEKMALPLARLEALFQISNSVDGWSDDDKAYYYFLCAGASRVLYKDNKAHLAFYAAQLYYNPDSDSMGWSYFAEPPSTDNAKMLHVKYPLPKTLSDVENYKY